MAIGSERTRGIGARNPALPARSAAAVRRARAAPTGHARLPRPVAAAPAADHRRRAALLVDLPETVSLEDGDALVLDDGRLVAVGPPPSRWSRSPPPPAELARLAWHIGNRHAPAEIERRPPPDPRDHVIEAMLARLGAAIRPVTAPFRPEGGAYGHGRTHGHHHGGAADDAQTTMPTTG